MPLISASRAREIASAAEERGGASQNVIPMGVNILKITKIEGKMSQRELPMVVLTYSDLENNFRAINEYFTIADDNPGVEILAQRLKVFNAHQMPELDTLDDLVKYCTKNMLGKKLKAAIRHEERLYKKTETEWYKNADARVAYCGPANEELTFDASKALKELSPEQKLEWDNYVREKRGESPAKPTKTAQQAPDDDDLEDEPAPVAKAKKEPAKAPKAVKPEEDDDLDIEERIPAGKSSTGESPVKASFLDEEDDDL